MTTKVIEFMQDYPVYFTVDERDNTYRLTIRPHVHSKILAVYDYEYCVFEGGQHQHTLRRSFANGDWISPSDMTDSLRMLAMLDAGDNSVTIPQDQVVTLKDEDEFESWEVYAKYKDGFFFARIGADN